MKAPPPPPSDDPALAELLAPYRRLRDPQARLSLAVEQARRRAPLPDAQRLDAHLVPGCLVRLWLVATWRDGRCWFATDSDAVTLKALTGLLAEAASGRPTAAARTLSPAFLEELGLLRLVAESRRATVLRTAGLMRDFAAGHAAETAPAAPAP
jgi:cysteine desulfuration protein SufE